LALAFDLLPFLLVQFARTVGWDFKLALGVAGEAAFLATQALGTQAPYAVAAEVAVGGNFECLVFEGMRLGSDGDIADVADDGGDFDFGCGSPSLGVVEEFLVVELGSHDFDFVALVFAFFNCLAHSLAAVYFFSAAFDFAF
jgi:hypothetical protein